jgi:hypothetical protein
MQHRAYGIRTAALALAWVAMMVASVRATTYTYYVTTDGDDTFDGSSWTNAFRTISYAVDQAKAAVDPATDDAVIYAGEGSFDVTAQVTLDEPIAIIGGTAPGATTATSIRRYGAVTFRVFLLDSSGARLEDLEVLNGYTSSADQHGANIRILDGTVARCSIRGGSARNYNNGGGISMAGGVVEDSEILNNKVWVASTGQTLLGCGVHMTGGVLRRCVIRNNFSDFGTSTTGSRAARGMGVAVVGAEAILESCLILENTLSTPASGDSGSTGAGVFVASSGGTVRNCTIVSNACNNTKTAIPCAGLSQQGGTVLNSIVSGNTYGANVRATGATNYFDNGSAQTVTYSCAPELAGGTGNLASDPAFLNPANDFHLDGSTSPCVNAGLNESWMTSATDLDGMARRQGGTVDMGAYEIASAPGTILIVL